MSKSEKNTIVLGGIEQWYFVLKLTVLLEYF